MGIFSRIGQALKGLGASLARGVKGIRSNIQKARSKPPEPPAGYKPQQPKVDAALRKAPTGSHPDLPEPVKPVEQPDLDTRKREEYAEYRDNLVSLVEIFDFPPEVINQLADIDIDALADADFIRLNQLIETLDRYKDEYLAGNYYPDYDFFIHEINESIPAVDLVNLEYEEYNPFSDTSDNDNWLTRGL